MPNKHRTSTDSRISNRKRSFIVETDDGKGAEKLKKERPKIGGTGL